jgi:CheY-like chemotaxis protein
LPFGLILRGEVILDLGIRGILMKNVYVIEDNEKNMKLFRAILKLIPNVEIFEETRGDLGFELIKSGDPDLVILDIQLPEMNGIEICRELRKNEKFKEIPIIAVTSFAMKGDKDRILAAGFDRYISKPIKVQEFRELVTKLL